MLLGASNSWFPDTLSALSLPRGSGEPIGEVVEEQWSILAMVDSRAELDTFVKANPGLRAALLKYDLDRVWQVIEARKTGGQAGGNVDLFFPEWELLTDPAHAPESNDLRLRDAGVPAAFSKSIERVVRAERLREVVALIGFTRIEGPDSGVASDVVLGPSAPVESKNRPTWLPASEVRGEGIFIQLGEYAVASWAQAASGTDRMQKLRQAHANWRSRRGVTPADEGWPGDRYVLIHSLSHAIINQVALECGYAAASIRERLYVRESDDPAQCMAGILLYTAVPDAEGTLGGLVRLGEKDVFEDILSGALERMKLCSADPFCAEHEAEDSEDVLHSAACHACLFVPETSCERGNRYLDRAVLTDTIATVDVPAFFG